MTTLQIRKTVLKNQEEKKTSLLSISEVFLQTIGVEINADGPELFLKL